tara:strand:- start:453 stop:1415 length:963 start_codon:yes stop_codon:yes gene_type:complete
MNSILVTGGAGYIGSKIVLDLIKNKKKVIVIDNLSTGYKALINKKAKFYKINFSSNKIKSIVEKNNVDTIIHCAASTNVSESKKNKKKYFVNNVYRTKIFLNNLRKTKIKNFIYSSTCAVYGNVKKNVNENTKVNPTNYYGVTKLRAENIIKKYSKKIGYKYVILRYFNVAGSDNKNKIGIYKNNGQLIKNIAISIKKKNFSVNIFGNKYKTKDGTCIRDFIHINDISLIHLLALRKINLYRKNLLFNCGYGKGFSILKIINIFEKLKKIKIKKNIKKNRPGDIVRMVSNNSKIKKLLKFKNRYTIQDIIKSSLIWEINR